MKNTVQITLIIAFLWLGSLLFLTTTFNPSGDRTSLDLPSLEQLSTNLNRVGFQTEELKRYTKELKNILEAELGKDSILSNVKQDKLNIGKREADPILSVPDRANNGEPDIEYERIRRKVDNGVVELWYYLRSELKKLQKTVDVPLQKSIDRILTDGADQQRSILVDMYNLSLHDGYSNWRREEIQKLRTLVRKRFHYLQNPKDCNNAKKLVCNLNKGCGYGCQVHHVGYCMIVAYATERTLILESKGWRYARGGWETVFQPLSQTCTSRGSSHAIRWQDPASHAFKNSLVVELPIVDGLHPRPKFLPLAIPEDLSERLIRAHGDPFVWWMGQIMHYILRPQDTLREEMEEAEKKHNFVNPIVGVHVRRTDKVGTEAAFHGIEEYMFHVEEYYKKLERIQKVEKRRVYLATDDDNLLQEAKAKYPDYLFISDNDISKSAALASRYSENALRGVILDIHFLSKTDYLVCTFSSQVCRVAYELMQDYHTDASAYFHSLDDIYYYGGQNGHQQIALYDHEPKDSSEIQLKVGDIVGVAGNHWDGYSKGTNHRLGRHAGLYPSYKVENKIEIAKMPLYPEAENYQLET